MTNKAFTEAMQTRGYERRRTSAGQAWQGLMLAPDDEPDERSLAGWIVPEKVGRGTRYLLGPKAHEVAEQ